MTLAEEAKSGSEAKRLAQFQLQGNAAERYERWVVPFISGPWAPALLDLVGLRAGERVLDVACGTGVVSRLAARRVAPSGTVTGLDLNEGMLSVAERLPLPPGLTIDWRQGSALALPFADRAFDVVVCQHGLMFFPDRVKALGEIRRVLTPVGRVAVSVWTGPSPYFTAQREGLARYVSAEAASTGAVAFSLGDPAELGDLLENAGFSRCRCPPRPNDAPLATARGIPAGTPVRSPASRARCRGRRRNSRCVDRSHEGCYSRLCRRVWLGRATGGQRGDRACGGITTRST